MNHRMWQVDKKWFGSMLPNEINGSLGVVRRQLRLIFARYLSVDNQGVFDERQWWIVRLDFLASRTLCKFLGVIWPHIV